jgi:hypothetical protein
MSDESIEPEAPEADMAVARTRLKKAREAVGKRPEDLGEFVCNVDCYYDLEAHDSEMHLNISLRELTGLSSALGIKARDLFDDGKNHGSVITPNQLIGMVKKHLSHTGISISEFENRVGYEIEPDLADFSKVMDWNLDLLLSVCHEIGLDWRSVLP